VSQLLHRVESGVEAYAPYSHYPVFAALRFEGGAGELLPPIFGCNIENASYVGCCAERMALASAGTVAPSGFRLREVAVLTGALSAAPCGTCRQAIHEAGADVAVTFRWNGTWDTRSADELLPHAPDMEVFSQPSGAIGSTGLLGYARDQAMMKDVDQTAAVRSSSGVTYLGVAVGYGFAPAVHPLENAIFAAINAEGPKVCLTDAAVYGSGRCSAPSGGARQTLVEFSRDIAVSFLENGAVVKMPILELLPFSFELDAGSHPG